MAQVLVKIPETLQKEGLKLVKELGYTSLQEAVREALRDKIQAHKKQKAIIEIQKLYGSAKNAKIATKEELDVLAKKLYF